LKTILNAIPMQVYGTSFTLPKVQMEMFTTILNREEKNSDQRLPHHNETNPNLSEECLNF